MKLKGKSILITGANRGIGRALVEQALEFGAQKIYATARNIDKLSHFNAKNIEKVELNINSKESIERLALKIKDVEILINNAGVLGFGSTLNAKIEDIEKDFQTNFFGTLNVIRAFAPSITQNKEGAIANVLSIVALASMESIAGYSASKAALWSLTQSLRAELKSTGTKVFAIFPGPIDTDMAKEFALDKTSTHEAAINILKGIENENEDIFPDNMSKTNGNIWLKNPKELEHLFSGV
ncbi:SDR family oxidoreductase [Pigmentibacter sp. JX0631]|uniref:SDR family oxidoreductase n=1 Tax=Pigmentibacter sp. JX0631 TaxID=2976982 RepID=UPI002468DBC2|nr:SDR family oxidoreductase [Pigmentibacter sp. JX0631]WGL59232.1 SDR family oxidoreductase [Pigmentibacter sp. JX0631]